MFGNRRHLVTVPHTFYTDEPDVNLLVSDIKYRFQVQSNYQLIIEISN